MAIATDGFQDPALQWLGAHERICELVEGVPEDALNLHVPATPDWRARDLLAHIVGLGHDVLAGEEPDDHNDAWTQKHVDERAHWSVAAILDQWRFDRDALLVYLRDVSPRPVNDAIIHEQDLRGALQTPGAREGGGMFLVRKAMLPRLRSGVEEAGLAPVRLESDDWTWSSADDAPGVVLKASSFDLTRALTSRRTADQLRSWVVAGDVEPYLDAFATVGPLPTTELPE